MTPHILHRPEHQAWYKEKIFPRVGKLFTWTTTQSRMDIYTLPFFSFDPEGNLVGRPVVFSDNCLMFTGCRCVRSCEVDTIRNFVREASLTVWKDLYLAEFLHGETLVSFPISPTWVMHDIFDNLVQVIPQKGKTS